MTNQPEKRPTAGERAKRLMERAWQHERRSQEDFAAQEIEAAERAAREEALEEAARVPAEAGLYGIVDRIRAIKAPAPPPAPPPPSQPVTGFESRFGALVRRVDELEGCAPFSVREWKTVLKSITDRVAELEAAVGRHEHRLQAPPVSKVERAREVAQAVAVERAWWLRSIQLTDGVSKSAVEDILRKERDRPRLDAAKGGAA